MAHLDQLHPRIQAVELDTGLLTRPFFRWLSQLYERVGGPEDFIADTEIGDLYESSISESRTDVTKKQLEDLETEFYMSPIWNTYNFFTTKVFSTSTAFTTYDNCIVIVTSNVTITLNANPKDQEKAIIKRNTEAGQVIIASSPINIDGMSTYTLLVNREAAHCVYSEKDNEWFIV